MSDDFFAGWTDLGDDTDDPFNATSAAVLQQSVQPPPATQAEPALSRPGCSVVKWTGGFVGRSRTRMSGGRGE